MSLLKYLTPDPEPLKIGLRCLCPKCAGAPLFKQKNWFEVRDKCPNCGLDLSKQDSADGPAVFLIFILGFTIVPAALLLELYIEPPLWLHALIWGVLSVGLTLATLRPLRAYIIALQYKHLPWDR